MFLGRSFEGTLYLHIAMQSPAVEADHRGGTHKVSKSSNGGGKTGEVDTSFREIITLFRLTTDAMVKVHCVYLTTRTS